MAENREKSSQVDGCRKPLVPPEKAPERAFEIAPSCIDATSRNGGRKRFMRALLFRCDTKTVLSMPVCEVVGERRRSQFPAQNILTIPASNGQSSSRPEASSRSTGTREP